MTPMLAKTYGPKYDKFPCFLQCKLNGVRALYQSGTFQSRDEKLWKPGVLSHLVEQLRPLSFLEGLILDGELYVHSWRLQRINGAVAVNRSGPRDDTNQVQFHIFDVIDPKNPNALFSERWCNKAAQPLVRYFGNVRTVIQPVQTDFVNSRKEVEDYFRLYTSQGYEGVMLRPDGPYEVGQTPHGTQFRSKFLWKYKKWMDGEFTCYGVTPGEGKASIGIGALVCCTANGRPFNVGTGFSDEERIEYMQNPPVGKMIKVRYIGLSEDGIPLNPSFLCIM